MKANTPRTQYSLESVIRKGLYTVFLFFCFFPYLQIIPTDTDMQPNALFLAIVLFFTFKNKFRYSDFLLGFLFAYSILMLFIGEFNFTTLRSILNYTSLFFISYTSFRVLLSRRINLDLFLKFSILVWFFVAAVQTLIYPSFLTFLVSASRTTIDRGVTGLAPEPTFLGVVFIFFIIYLLHLETQNKKKYIALCVIGIILLAKSSMAALFLIILVAIRLLVEMSFRLVCWFSIILVLFFFIISSSMQDSRIGFLLGQLLENPSNLVLLDASINDRFFHVFFSLKGFVTGYFMPHGYSAWTPYVTDQIFKYSDLVIVEWFSLGGRIMSGYGSAFYELGFPALLIPSVLFYSLRRLYKHDLRKFLFFFGFVNLIMFSAIPLGFPLFAFYIGYINFLAVRNKV